jgi:16S rRNA (guanine(966)-N(2))-methyltransferase RsmD
MAEIKVIAGELKGRKIRAPKDERARPVTHMVREAVFGVLASRVEGASVWDCFAGSGGYGIEAISRGAVRATFSEINLQNAQNIKATLEDFKIGDKCFVFRGDFRLAVKKFSREGLKFDIIFFDPPFIPNFYRFIFENRLVSTVFKPETVAIVEHPVKWSETIAGLIASAGFEIFDSRVYGQTQIDYIRLAPIDGGET